MTAGQSLKNNPTPNRTGPGLNGIVETCIALRSPRLMDYLLAPPAGDALHLG